MTGNTFFIQVSNFLPLFAQYSIFFYTIPHKDKHYSFLLYSYVYSLDNTGLMKPPVVSLHLGCGFIGALKIEVGTIF